LSVGGRQHQVHLIKAPNDRDGKKLAEARLVEELAARQLVPKPEGGVKAPGWLTVAHVLRGFLKHSRYEHEKATADWYEDLLEPFTPRSGKLRYSRLRKRHVRAWLRELGYNATSANKAVGALKRAFNWAVEEEHIPRSPVAHVRKPKALTR